MATISEVIQQLQLLRENVFSGDAGLMECEIDYDVNSYSMPRTIIKVSIQEYSHEDQRLNKLFNDSDEHMQAMREGLVDNNDCGTEGCTACKK